MPERWKIVALFAEKPGFWAAIAGAILVKVLTTRSLNFWQVCATTISALFFAVVFTAPMLHWWSLPSSPYEPAVAAVLALFGEHIARLVLQSQSIAELIRAWRGK